MNRQDCLKLLNQIFDSKNPLEEETYVAACDEIDSLSLLNVFVQLRKVKPAVTIVDLMKCKRIKDIVDLFCN